MLGQLWLWPGFSEFPGSLLWTWELSPDYIYSSRLLAPGETVWKFWHRSLPYSYRLRKDEDLGFGEIFLVGLSRGCPTWKTFYEYLILVGLCGAYPSWRALWMNLNRPLVPEEPGHEILGSLL